ncbi:MAG: nucleoid-associated protein [Verrucomicrobiota bacterium]
MSFTLHFRKAKLAAMCLAKVGNPVKGGKLQTSRSLCRFDKDEAELLTHCFLKSFRSLELHQLHHHTSLESNELFGFAAAIFEDESQLLEQGELIAKHLFARSNHPNIKSGDLCIALIRDISVSGHSVSAISLVKSESKVPFLQISERDGDLILTTEQGIYPDKIDKGCLIVNHGKADGYAVYLFDKSGAGTQFWVRDFVGARPVANDDFLTKRYSELCVAFADRGLPADTRKEERLGVASRAMTYLNEADEFARDEFETKALKTPERIDQFDRFKQEFESERGSELQDSFTISKSEAAKAEKKLRSKLKLDSGVTLQFSPHFIHHADDLMERGVEEETGRHFIKLFYQQEIGESAGAGDQAEDPETNVAEDADEEDSPPW